MQYGFNESLNLSFSLHNSKNFSALPNSFKNMGWILAIIFCLLLNGCATRTPCYQKDGPPPFDVDVSKIPNAKPKVERRAKYGNMSIYRVKGQNYCVMQNAKHYEERGMASWYGMRFHKLRTSSGEPYDLLAMTAAHKTLPLPTYVEVTNLRNHRKVIVKVNDRGPFACNRIIDLSYVAAKKLGMLGHGTAYVDVKAIDPNEAFSHRSLWAHNKCVKTNKYVAVNHCKGVYLQVGAFKSRLYAERLRTKLQLFVSSPIEITGRRIATLNSPSQNLYRVNIGPIQDVATVDTIKRKLRARGFSSKHIKV